MTVTNKFILWGGTGQAKVIADILYQQGISIHHIFDKEKIDSPLSNVPISFGFDGLNKFINQLNSLCLDPSDFNFVVSIGGSRGHDREQLSMRLCSHGFLPTSVIHPSAVISEFSFLSSSLQVLANVHVASHTYVGEGTILNSCVNLEHDSSVGRFCHIGPSAVVTGQVTISDYVFIGANATILPNLTIGKGAIVGAGSVVTKNVPAGATVVGNPARILSI